MCDLQAGGTNKRGFLSNPGAWSPEVAKALAGADGIALSDAHWSVIQAIRDLYQASEVPTSYHVLCPLVDDALQPLRCNCVHAMKRLFPDGGIRQASRIAGLPDYFRFD
jgi:dissimilatory sulfite reductase related protein